MTPDAQEYGHKGPLKERVFEVRGDTVDTLRCEHCHVAVPPDELEKLEEHDCEQYAELVGEAEKEIREQWD